MSITRTRSLARVLRNLRIAAAISSIARLFLGLWDHWRCHVLIRRGSSSAHSPDQDQLFWSVQAVFSS